MIQDNKGTNLAVMETVKRADNNDDDIGQIIQDLTQVVEKEIRAFQSLLDALLEQQTSILKGDTESVSQSSEKVEKIVAKTKALEKEWKGKSRDLTRHLDVEEELTLSQLIPLVEKRYTDRLIELRETLLVLSEKIQNTNKRNRYLLEHSIKFVDNSLRFLIKSCEKEISYNEKGMVEVNEVSLYKGVG